MDKALAIQKEVQEILGTKEVYLPIVGYEGSYEVSNLGGIRSVDRIVTHRRGKLDKPHNTMYRGKVLKQKIDKYGYATVCIMINGKRKYTTVHRLVALSFIPNPDNLPQVNHKDTNKLNNSVGNLEWVTALGNITHAIDNGLQKYASGEGLPQTALTQVEVATVKKLLSLGKTQISIAEKFNVNKNVIWRISKGLSWKKV